MTIGIHDPKTKKLFSFFMVKNLSRKTPPNKGHNDEIDGNAEIKAQCFTTQDKRSSSSIRLELHPDDRKRYEQVRRERERQEGLYSPTEEEAFLFNDLS